MLTAFRLDSACATKDPSRIPFRSPRSALEASSRRPPPRLAALTRQASARLVQKLRGVTRAASETGGAGSVSGIDSARQRAWHSRALEPPRQVLGSGGVDPWNEYVQWNEYHDDFLHTPGRSASPPGASRRDGRPGASLDSSSRRRSSGRPKKKGAVTGRKPGRAGGRGKANELPALKGAERRPERGAPAPPPATASTATAGAEVPGGAQTPTEAQALPAVQGALPAAKTLPAVHAPTEAEALQAKEEARAAAVESKRLAFWAAQERRRCWSVPLARNLSAMPWLGARETGLDAAIAMARSLGRTPLLVDPQGLAAAYLAQRQAVHLDVKQWLVDERLGVRSHALVMKEARKQLVHAMRAGRPLHVAFGSCTADFITRYSADDTLPLSIFDQRVVEALAEFTGEGADDLWEDPRHPFSQALRPNDLELNGRFSVGEGFEVIVSTQLDEEVFASRLALSVPLLRLQPMAPAPW